MVRISTQRACSRSNRLRRLGGQTGEQVEQRWRGRAGVATAAAIRRAPIILTSIALRNRGIDTSPVEIRQLARGDQRQQHRRERREHRGRGAAAEQQQVPAEEERLPHVVRHRRFARRAGGRRRRGWQRRGQSSPARVEASSLSMVSRMSKQRSTNSGSRCISLGGRCGAGSAISRRIVPGADEKT